jgi:phage terminase large subunit
MRAMPGRKKVVKGGTGAGKTGGIIPILADKAIKTDGLKITTVAETIPAVKDGPVDIFQTFMYDTGRWNENGWIGNPMQYTYSNRTRMQFKAFDTVGKAKAAGKRDILFLNEANHIPYPIADALITRSKEIWIDYNPDHESWIEKEILQEPNVTVITLTYKDNEGCPAETIEEIDIKIRKAFHDPFGNWKDKDNIKSEFWANWCYVYVLGEMGALQGAVLTNWSQIDEVPPDAKLLRHGLDFGFHPDPAGCLSVYEWNDHLVVHENYYRTRMLTSDHIQALQKLAPGDIMCDNSNPLMIAELQKAKLRAKPCVKGKDSIDYGISQLQEQKILVTKSSLNLINELRKYVYDENEKPIDAFNHLIDPLRYAFVTDPKPAIKTIARAH